MSFDVADVPLLEGWIVVTEAAEKLGLSKQAVHGLIRTQELKSVRKIKQTSGNYIYVLDPTEVEALASRRLIAGQRKTSEDLSSQCA